MPGYRSPHPRILHPRHHPKVRLGSLGLIAEDGDRYGNAMAIVAIHAAIAYADAL